MRVKTMRKRVVTKARYHGDAKAIFKSAIDLNELSEAMRGLARYEGLPDHPCREGETYTVDVITLKIIKTKGYQMFIVRLDMDSCVLQSREKGGAIRQWDHRLSVEQFGEQAVWTDDVVIDAGGITWLMARFAAYMYRRRHTFRKALHISTEITKAP